MNKISKVFFADISAKKKKSLLEKVESIAIRAGIKKLIDKNEMVAIKTHFGERGNTAFVPGIYLRRIVNLVKEAGGKPFLTDANTLYKGSRGNAVDHLQTAFENGFSYSSIGAPVIIADGLDGKDYREVPVNGKHFQNVKIGSAILSADALIAVSHFKGHEMTGFGGTLKNIGMGSGSRSAKQMMHSGAKPVVDEVKCTACKKCGLWCPTEAISVGEVAMIDEEKCYSCGECTVTCPEGAIGINWETSADDMHQKIVEHAAGALKGKEGKCLFINFLINITPDCDCWGWSDKAICNDIGVLASTDPVAAESASLDLLTKACGKDVIKEIWPNSNHTEQLRYAEELGLGSVRYELIEVE